MPLWNVAAVAASNAPRKLFHLTVVSTHGAVMRCARIVVATALDTYSVVLAETTVEPDGMNERSNLISDCAWPCGVVPVQRFVMVPLLAVGAPWLMKESMTVPE